MSWDIRTGHVFDLLAEMPAESVQAVVTSPPYFGLRAYGTEPVTWGGDPGCGHTWQGAIRPGQSGGTASAKVQIKGQANFQVTPDREHATCTLCGAWRGELGSEPTPALFVAHLVECFRAVRRVLRPDGVLFVNIGDSYSGSGKGPTGHNGIGDQQGRQGFGGHGARIGSKHGEIGHTSGVRPMPGTRAKSLLLIPERLALALSDDGWIVRSRVAWCKQAPMPESVRDRPTSAWEHVFMLTRSGRYHWDQEAVRELSASLEQAAQSRTDGKVSETYDAIARLRQPGSVNIGANLRNYWLLPPDPFPGAHFAVFPKRLAEIAIKAATSERGACAECGAPWARVVEREGLSSRKVRYVDGEAPKHNGRVVLGLRSNQSGLGGSNSHNSSTPQSPVTTTTGWSPTCRHADAPTRPCVVLDCFSGAGTVALVADRLGRHGIGLELNPEYAELSRRRITDDAPLFAALSNEEEG